MHGDHPTALFVTGLYRSGTTLVEKCLDQHPAVAMASQPLPLLWSRLKAEFLAGLGRDDELPLGPLFGESAYRHEQLVAWLDARRLSRNDLAGVADALRGYDGWWTPSLDGHLEELAPGSPAVVARRAASTAAALRGRRPAVVGLKEILVEELLDHFEARGFVTVVVVRDPIDVVSSLVRGRGQQIMGAYRPTLFHVRQWRRSVALGLRGAGPGRLVVAYEDVVADPVAALTPVAEAIGVDPELLPSDLDRLTDQQGGPWGGNSSFRGPRPESDPALVAWIELLTGPELVALGRRDGWRVPGVDELADFVEPVPIVREDVDPGLSTRPVELDAEVARLRLLAEPVIDVDGDDRWLLGAHAALRARCGGPGGASPGGAPPRE